MFVHTVLSKLETYTQNKMNIPALKFQFINLKFYNKNYFNI